MPCGVGYGVFASGIRCCCGRVHHCADGGAGREQGGKKKPAAALTAPAGCPVHRIGKASVQMPRMRESITKNTKCVIMYVLPYSL